ncbi:MAG TPA: hypothetical protein VF386_12020, partial [Usitatibacter sp.]
MILRLVRRRLLAIVIGLALAAPAGWIEFGGRDRMWWVEGLALVVGATGLAIFCQVLVESIVISLVGAALGVAASYGFVRVLESITPT